MAVTASETGTVTIPIPVNNTGWEAYIRAEARMIWPVARRRGTRRGALGCHVVRLPRKTTSRASTPSTNSDRPGLSTIWRKMSEPSATAPQKKSVAPVPNSPPAGTAKLRSRPCCSWKLIGSAQLLLVFGPVGPL